MYLYNQSSHCKFLNYHTSIDNYKYFPRIISKWSNLSQDVINKPTIDSFKQSLFNYISPKWALLNKQYNNNMENKECSIVLSAHPVYPFKSGFVTCTTMLWFTSSSSNTLGQHSKQRIEVPLLALHFVAVAKRR